MKHATRIKRTIDDTTTVVVCDRCGADVETLNVGDREDEVTIVAELGDHHRWEDGDDRKVTRVDCCSACWTAHVVPALERIGFVIRTRENYDKWRPDTIDGVKV